ncbi:hypothetical protein pdul_cds_992 [Pandoravirus dulcis]|uniref:Uncharacterized protein n=1 Tax=Pandoravirus dulcis TaxID=1349409 RepID=S4VSH2_9VIRU|nr:hypothetical protein pdul_cds_992 [Pandoravirus dulcis]AGO83252.1 hypothetical protein pdul_cds_992 [Pandoravirus dulcis]
MTSLTATAPLEPVNPIRGDDKDDACNPRHKGQADPFMERAVDATDGGDPAGTAHALVSAADPGNAAADDYDATEASYAALFDDGGLFSDFIAEHDQNFWDNADMMMATTTTMTSTLDHAVDAAARDLPYASVADAVDALLATCPRQASCKPATLALPRAPMVYVIKRHMRDHGGVDFGPAAGGSCATLDEACKRIDGLGPCDMLDRGVMAWVAGRLMDRVRPGSSHGIPVTPLSRIGTLVQREFGSGEWILEDPESLDQRFERPEHESLRALIAWTVDSARTVAVLRARASADETAARQPAGKDYTKGPLKRLAKERDAYRRIDATNSDVWAAFLLEQSKADEVRHTKKRRRLARTHPGPDVAAAAAATATAATAAAAMGDQEPLPAARAPPKATKATKATARSRKSGRAALTLSLPQGGAAPSAAFFAPPPVPPPPPAQSPPPTSLDVTALDRHILAQIQSFALMSLAAAGPAGIAAGAPVTFMAPSVSCPGTMALTCWVTVPSDAESESVRSKPRASGERPRKRHKRTRKTPAGCGPADAPPAGAPHDMPPPPRQLSTSVADDRDGADLASAVGERATAREPPAEAASPPAGANPPHDVPLYALADAPEDAKAARPCRDTDGAEMASATDSTALCTEDETIDQGIAQPRAFAPVDDDAQASGAPMAVDMPPAECNDGTKSTGIISSDSSSNNNYDLDQLLAADGDDDWDDLLACGRLPSA